MWSASSQGGSFSHSWTFAPLFRRATEGSACRHHSAERVWPGSPEREFGCQGPMWWGANEPGNPGGRVARHVRDQVTDPKDDCGTGDDLTALPCAMLIRRGTSLPFRFALLHVVRTDGGTDARGQSLQSSRRIGWDVVASLMVASFVHGLLKPAHRPGEIGGCRLDFVGLLGHVVSSPSLSDNSSEVTSGGPYQREPQSPDGRLYRSK